MTLTLPTEKHIQSVAHSPRSDGKQPGSGRTSSSVPVQAAPFPNQRRIVSPLLSSLAARGADESAAPFPHPQASSSQAAGNSASSVSDVQPLSFDPAFLAAWRETQGQPTDAEPRIR